MSDSDVAALLRSWRVVPTGAADSTATSTLVPGLRDGRPVMVKIAHIEEERRGARLLAWWAGRGAVPVLAREGDAVLMTRATGPRSLASMALQGDDEAATTVLVEAVLALHANGLPPDDAGVGLVPLTTWFRDLLEQPHPDPLLDRAAEVARRALGATRDPDLVALHGDVHHGNVLDLGDRWGAIDPKGLVGHRAFDVANLFCNPTASLAEARLDERLALVADRSGTPPELLIAWIVAWCGLSLVWGGGSDSDHPRAARSVLRRLLPRIV